jgi:hypothetical protein
MALLNDPVDTGDRAAINSGEWGTEDPSKPTTPRGSVSTTSPQPEPGNCIHSHQHTAIAR